MNKLLKVAANRSGPCCVYTASSGNHGIAVATAAQHLGGRGIRVTVLLPHGASQVKVEKIRCGPLAFAAATPPAAHHAIVRDAAGWVQRCNSTAATCRRQRPAHGSWLKSGTANT